MAGTCGRVAGVVGWVDLTAADVADALAALRAAPGGRALVGIRHQVHDEPDPAWLVRGEVLAGLAAVADAGLVYDLLVRERELPAARAVAERLPSSASSSTTWPSRGSVEAAGRAVGHRAARPGPPAQRHLQGLRPGHRGRLGRLDAPPARPLRRHAADAFGPDRLLFGSDWPVCLLAADYAEVVAAAEEALEAAGLEAGRARPGVRRQRPAGVPPTRARRRPRRLTMLRTRLIHPQILAALAEAGHGSQVLISDGNFPTPPPPRRRPAGLPEPLPGPGDRHRGPEAVAATVPLEAAAVMQPHDAPVPAVLGEYRELLPAGPAGRGGGPAGLLRADPPARGAPWPSPPATSGCTPTCC